ncbi:hypothetical protein ACJX0J_024938, partial [Zea mays]
KNKTCHLLRKEQMFKQDMELILRIFLSLKTYRTCFFMLKKSEDGHVMSQEKYDHELWHTQLMPILHASTTQYWI